MAFLLFVLDHFFRRVALMVSTSQIVDQLLPEFSLLRSMAATGGSDAEKKKLTLNPFRRVTDKPVVFWSGVLAADQTEREVTYDVPDYFNGTLAVMAVACAPNAVGSAETKSLVRGAFVLSPGVPTFAAPGDVFDVSVTVANNVENSGDDAAVRLQLEPSAHFEIVGASALDLKVGEGKETSALFKLRVKDMLGSGQLIFRAAAPGGESSQARATVSVRPPGPFLTLVRSGNFYPAAAVISAVIKSWTWDVVEELCQSSNIVVLLKFCTARHSIDQSLGVGAHQDAKVVAFAVPLSLWIPLQDIVPGENSGLGFVVRQPQEVGKRLPADDQRAFAVEVNAEVETAKQAQASAGQFGLEAGLQRPKERTGRPGPVGHGVAVVQGSARLVQRSGERPGAAGRGVQLRDQERLVVGFEPDHPHTAARPAVLQPRARVPQDGQVALDVKRDGRANARDSRSPDELAAREALVRCHGFAAAADEHQICVEALDEQGAAVQERVAEAVLHEHEYDREPNAPAAPHQARRLVN